MTPKATDLIVVTGYFGAPIEETARQIAESRSFALVSLDDEIVRRDGRSILRICMLEGEHSYRNKEYEILDILAKAPSPGGIVVWCGDGVLHDDMSREIAMRGELVIAGEDMSEEELWQRARLTGGSYHAFMAFGTEDEKREKFHHLYDRQKLLFDKMR